MKNRKLLLGIASAGLFLSACSASHNGNSVSINPNSEDLQKVGNVHWHKTEKENPDHILDKNVPANNASVFFIRDNDQGSVQTSVNIAINDRFQVSLQPNHYSQVYTCAGVNRISGNITGTKNNNLLHNVQNYNLDNGQSYFFRVVVDASGQVEIIPVQEQSEVAQTRLRQSHQISRVVPVCEANPTLDSIQLAVYFDTDKSVVKSKYYREIERVVSYLSAHPQARVVIEGHTDNRASESYNQRLSQRRVDAVKDVLVKRYGIVDTRIQAVGYGESRPIASNDTAEGRAQNRRVMAVFYNN